MGFGWRLQGENILNKYWNWPSSPRRFVRFDTARAEEVNAAFDELSVSMDTLNEDINRAIKVPGPSSDQLINLTPLQRAGLMIGFDAFGKVAALPVGGRFRGDWATGTAYVVGDNFRDSLTGNLYAVKVSHTATILNNDIIAGYNQMTVNVSDVVAARNAAQTAAAAALVSQNSATSSASAANSSKNSAANSEINAASSATAADGHKNAAASSASAAATSASNAASSASTAAGVVTTVNNAATTATNAANTASGHATTASNHASAAATSAGTASTKAGEAATSASNASTSAGNAASSASTAAGHVTTAGNSATAASNSASAAAGSASTAGTKAGEASTSASNAATSASNAASSENKAYQWAQHPEDTEVEAGKYSAYHWSLKAEEFAIAASGGASWLTLPGKPAVIAAGDTALDARNVIGAGTSNLAIGTTAVTAKAGNWTPSMSDVSGLNAALSNKADVSALAGKADVSALANKVDKITGKGLSTNDYTTPEQSKLASLKLHAVWFRYVGATPPDTTGWAVNDVWFDTSTPPTFTTAQQAIINGKASTALATVSVNGLMSAADKTKLNGVAVGATNLAIGPLATNAKAGNYAPSAAEIATLIHAGVGKYPLVDNDELAISDSTGSWGLKRASFFALRDSLCNFTQTWRVNQGFNGFVKIGELAPLRKEKVVPFTTGPSAGSIATVAHGLTQAKIICMVVQVVNAGGTTVPANLTLAANNHYESYFNYTDIVVVNGSSSSDVWNKPGKAYIIYEE